MSESADDELRILRTRAYGPNADIHRDPDALRRLRELEDARRPPSEAVSEPAPTPDPIPIEEPGEPDAAPLAAPPLVERLARVRRSSWLIVAGLLAVAGILVTALVLVQRVQVDPLQTGARQVARLSLDPDYAIPAFFGSVHDGKGDVRAFQEFHGLRVIVAPGGIFAEGGNEDCLTLFSSRDTKIDSDSFSGFRQSGCAAGDFPAIVQFRSDISGFPAELKAAFPDSTPLQFVYDRKDNEVVVFAAQ